MADVLQTVPFFVLSAVFGLMSVWFQKHVVMVGSYLPPESKWVRIAMAGRIFWFYLYKIILPLKLNVVYPAWRVNPASPLAYLPDAFFFIGIAVCWWFRRKCGGNVLFGLGVFAITLFPALGLFDSQFLTKWRVSDHLQYLPMIAPIALGAAALARLPRMMFVCAATVIIISFSVLTHQRARVFASEESLFRDTLAKNPAAWGIQSDLGALLASQGKYDEAVEHLRTSLQYNSEYNPGAESHLGEILLIQGKPDEAEQLFKAALSAKPDDSETHKRYAHLLVQQRRISEALCQQRMAIDFSLEPETRLRLNNAALLHQAGDVGQAEARLREVLAMNPDSVEALNNLAWMLATAPDDDLRNGVEAVKLAEKASSLPPVDGLCVPGTLAAAYAEAGRFSEAIATAEDAVATEENTGQPRFAAMNRQLLQLYRQGQPFHERPANADNPQ
jgi:Tfp pilus assembly protein PilF